MNALMTLAPDRVVYISCNPETLARDLAYLTGERGRKNMGRYRVVKMAAVDMFAFTEHVECVIMMQYCGKEKKK